MTSKNKKLVRHVGDKTHFPLMDAFRCAISGIKYSLVSQRNFKIHAVFAALAILLGILFQIPQASWFAIILSIMIVFSLEVLNTSIESIVDLVSPEWHELAMRAKDCSAGAVFVSAIGSLVIAAFVFIPEIVDFILLLRLSRKLSLEEFWI